MNRIEPGLKPLIPGKFAEYVLKNIRLVIRKLYFLLLKLMP